MKNKRIYILIVIMMVLCLLITVIFYRDTHKHYKIGASGEYGEITIMNNYIILGHYTSIFSPKVNYIQLPIKCDYSVLTFEIYPNNCIRINSSPNITSYELSNFKHVAIGDTAILSSSKDMDAVFSGNIVARGCRLCPDFWFRYHDSTFIQQCYLQTFPHEDSKNAYFLDTVQLTLP